MQPLPLQVKRTAQQVVHSAGGYRPSGEQPVSVSPQLEPHSVHYSSASSDKLTLMVVYIDARLRFLLASAVGAGGLLGFATESDKNQSLKKLP